MVHARGDFSTHLPVEGGDVPRLLFDSLELAQVGPEPVWLDLSQYGFLPMRFHFNILLPTSETVPWPTF
jgi:hypothetical protein